MIQVFKKVGFYIQIQITDFGIIVSFASKNWKSFYICFTKKRKESDKNHIRLRLSKIYSLIEEGIQKQLTNFHEVLDKIIVRVHEYIPRLKTPVCKLNDNIKLSEIEKSSYVCYPEYKGDIRHLFMFYDWNKVDEIEKKYDAKERHYTLTSILKAHIFMCKRRIRTYTDLIEEFHENSRLPEVCGFKSNSIPSRTIISRVADVFGIEAFRDVAVEMVNECLFLGLIKGRIVGVYGSLIKSNTSPYKDKELGEYTDKDAGMYVRGSYIKGVGHLSYKLVDLEYGLSMLLQRYKGSANENPLLIDILFRFYDTYGFYPGMLSIDKGIDSAANNEFCNAKGISAYIQARNFKNKDLIKTERGKTFNPEYMEITDLRVLERIADRRSECEREFSRDKWI
ncbi:MAG: hypothetical protein SCH70_11970 [Candidatus Methanoperedens sp.]|nr:hypothetical protein [Candidatus Methanoperedens sp.]